MLNVPLCLFPIFDFIEERRKEALLNISAHYDYCLHPTDAFFTVRLAENLPYPWWEGNLRPPHAHECAVFKLKF